MTTGPDVTPETDSGPAPERARAKEPALESGPGEIVGRLRTAVVAPGSKSEREALVLDADDGRVLSVRRRGGPAFGADDSGPGADLAELAAWSARYGRRVVVTGSVVAGTLLADTWRSLGEPAPPDPPMSG